MQQLETADWKYIHIHTHTHTHVYIYSPRLGDPEPSENQRTPLLGRELETMQVIAGDRVALHLMGI